MLKLSIYSPCYYKTSLTSLTLTNFHWFTPPWTYIKSEGGWGRRGGRNQDWWKIALSSSTSGLGSLYFVFCCCCCCCWFFFFWRGGGGGGRGDGCAFSLCLFPSSNKITNVGLSPLNTSTITLNNYVLQQANMYQQQSYILNCNWAENFAKEWTESYGSLVPCNLE